MNLIFVLHSVALVFSRLGPIFEDSNIIELKKQNWIVYVILHIPGKVCVFASNVRGDAPRICLLQKIEEGTECILQTAETNIEVNERWRVFK